MTDMMIYATSDKVGGTVESIWGADMRVKRIDSSNKEAVEQAKADGWQGSAQVVIDEIEGAKLKAENNKMKGKLLDSKDQALITQLQAENKVLTDKLAIYESSKDTNEDGVVSYNELTNAELQKLLEQRKVDYNKRDGKDTLIKLAQDSE